MLGGDLTHGGERLVGRGTIGREPLHPDCRQRGRLTPRNTGSSAKPLPGPNQGYEHHAALTSPPGGNHHGDGPKNCLTNKEDSFGSGPRLLAQGRAGPRRSRR